MKNSLNLLLGIVILVFGSVTASQFRAAPAVLAQDPVDPEPVINCEEVDCDTICDDIELAQLDFILAEMDVESAIDDYNAALAALQEAQAAYNDARDAYLACTGNCTAERDAAFAALQDLDEAEIEADGQRLDALAAIEAYEAAGEALSALIQQKNQCCPDTSCS